MPNHNNLDRSIEEAGQAIGKTPREIEQAKEAAHEAVDSGQVPEEVIEETMHFTKQLADAANEEDGMGGEGNHGGSL